MKKLRFTAAAIILAVLLTVSCSVEQDVALNRDGSGSADITITLHPVLVRYFQDLMFFAGAPADAKIFDTAQVAAAFASIPDLELYEAEVPDTARLHLKVGFTDIGKAFYSQVDPDTPAAASITREAGAWRADFHYGRDNSGAIISRILQVTGMDLFSDYLGALLEPGSEEEILDIYEFAFEEYAEEGNIGEIIRQSEIVMRFRPPAGVLNPRKGTARRMVTENGTVRYTFSLLDLLTLEKPAAFQFYFR